MGLTAQIGNFWLLPRICKLDPEIVVFKDQGSKKDTETNTCSIAIRDNISLSQTGNLPVE